MIKVGELYYSLVAEYPLLSIRNPEQYKEAKARLELLEFLLNNIPSDDVLIRPDLTIYALALADLLLTYKQQP